MSQSRKLVLQNQELGVQDLITKLLANWSHFFSFSLVHLVVIPVHSPIVLFSHTRIHRYLTLSFLNIC